MMPNYRPEAIANAFLQMPGSSGLTQMHLQKLSYIAHGWNLAINNEPLSAVEPEAWDRGPVFRELRAKTRYAGSGPVDGLIRENDDNPFAYLENTDRGNPILANFLPEEREVLDHVWRRYGRRGAFALSDLTHEPGTPWYQVYHGQGAYNGSIPNDLIRDHYLQLANAAA